MKQISIPDSVHNALSAGAALAISISGGKDSQAMLALTIDYFRREKFTGPVFAIHADLGRAEWHQTPEFVQSLAKRYGVDLVIVQRNGGDLLDRIHDRRSKLEGTGRPFWPSSAQRYCTSDLKRGPIDVHLRKFNNVVCAMGIRADESTARSKKPECAPRKQIITKSRNAIDWNPILHFSEADVWEACGTSSESIEHYRALYPSIEGSEAEQALFEMAGVHPAYVIGNERLSCALCVLASRRDLERGAKHNPAIYEEYVALERQTGITFRDGFSLEDLAT